MLHCACVFIVFASGTAVHTCYIFLYIYLFECFRSETECRLTQYYFLLCSPCLGQAVIETWVVLGTIGRVLLQLSFCHLPLLSEWCGGFNANCKERLEASEFF